MNRVRTNSGRHARARKDFTYSSISDAVKKIFRAQVVLRAIYMGCINFVAMAAHKTYRLLLVECTLCEMQGFLFYMDMERLSKKIPQSNPVRSSRAPVNARRNKRHVALHALQVDSRNLVFVSKQNVMFFAASTRASQATDVIAISILLHSKTRVRLYDRIALYFLSAKKRRSTRLGPKLIQEPSRCKCCSFSDEGIFRRIVRFTYMHIAVGQDPISIHCNGDYSFKQCLLTFQV